mmetsp:Transcript_17708/g.38448  ORF Transcript_17708/g.38448 Transcript_17708/m.38448 type:complete len:83 (-) Transcript_17708:28-276(-)
MWLSIVDAANSSKASLCSSLWCFDAMQTSGSLPKWSTFDSAALASLQIGHNETSIAITTAKAYHQETCDFWESENFYQTRDK